MSNDKPVDKHHKSNGGEIQGVREARDRMIGRLIESGNSPDYARRKATEAAQRFDRNRG